MQPRWNSLRYGLWLCILYTSMSAQAAQKPQEPTLIEAKYAAALQEISRLQNELETLKTKQVGSNDAAPAQDFFLAGNAYVNLRQYAEAVDAYTRAIARDPHNALAFRNRGIAYIALGAYQKALRDFDQALEHASEDAVAYNHRGIVHYALNHDQQAIRDFTKAIEHNPKLAAGYNNRGIVSRRLGNARQASADFSRAAQLGMNVASQHLQVVRDDVRKVQERLQAEGLDPGQADGVMGPKTTAALQQYQRLRNIPATGFLDEETRAALQLTPSASPPSLASDHAASRFVHQPRPDYPLEARQQGWEGDVTLQLELLADGQVGDVKVAKSSGHDVLDTAAREAAKMWTHAPTMQNGQAMTQWVQVTLTFTLDNSSKAKEER